MKRETRTELKFFETPTFNSQVEITHIGDFLGGLLVKNPPCNVEDSGSIPGLRGFYMPQSS